MQVGNPTAPDSHTGKAQNIGEASSEAFDFTLTFWRGDATSEQKLSPANNLCIYTTRWLCQQCQYACTSNTSPIHPLV